MREPPLAIMTARVKSCGCTPAIRQPVALTPVCLFIIPDESKPTKKDPAASPLRVFIICDESKATTTVVVFVFVYLNLMKVSQAKKSLRPGGWGGIRKQ